MEFIVEKKKTDFIFYQNQKPIWKVELLSAFWGHKIAIINLEKKESIALILKKLRLIINAGTKISFNDRALDKILNIPIKFFTCKIDFQYKGYYYEFIEHSELNYSIFKDNIQIGMYKKKHINLKNNECLLLSVNNDVDIALIISILTIADLSFHAEEGVNINAGNLIISKKKFDKNWRPY